MPRTVDKNAALQAILRGAMTTTRKKQSATSDQGTAGSAIPAAQRDLEARLGYTFRSPALLELALTHRSYAYEARHGVPAVVMPVRPEQREQRNTPGTDNERLEFLGDAVIGLIVTEALFHEFPECSEGELTRLRSNLVSRKRMADMGTELGLGEALLMGKSAEQNGGRRKMALLANAAEAVLAAVYLDAGEDRFTVLQALAARYLVNPEIAAMRAALAGDAGRGAMRDHKTLLQERVQAEGAGKLRYIDTDQSGPAHQRVFSVEARLENDEGTRVLASAQGSSKKEAQQRAAELALATWNEVGSQKTRGAR
jgi:ribonuclease-3